MSSSTDLRAIAVSLGDRSYEVLIGCGLLAQTGAALGARFGAARCAVVTDENVAALHLETLTASLGERCRGTIVLPPGEQTKCFARLAEVCERLLALGIERGDLVIALGGGVIGDLAGFASAILRRGVRFVQVPTSLLAQVDSSVGGKTGINTAQGKNLVGSFHQPSLVLADINTLSTLPMRQMRAGYAEVVKYGLLGDAAFFERLEMRWPALFGNDSRERIEAVVTSVAAKASIVARDETEQGDRMLLNLGHTFGHALESWAGYSDRLLHGEAVAIGMAQAFRFSAQHGYCTADTATRVARHLQAVGLPTQISDIPGQDRPTVDVLAALMAQDKKVRDGQMTFILAHGIGQAFVTRDIAPDAVAAFLARELALEKAKA